MSEHIRGMTMRYTNRRILYFTIRLSW